MQTAIVGGDVTMVKAREAFLAYRNLVKEGRATEDDDLLMRAYKTIMQGKRVLDLRETLKIGGLDDKLRPRLAIARADTKHVTFTHIEGTWKNRLQRWCYTNNPQARRVGFSSGMTIAVPRGCYAVLDDASWNIGPTRYHSLRAAVPPIPVQFRPAGRPSGFHILWEAEWEPVAPHDPILLKRIGAYLFAVLAQWDLTELERAVLGARLS